MSNKGKIYLALVIFGVIASLYLISASSRGLFPFSENAPVSTASPIPTPTPTPMIPIIPNESGQPCIQIITPARNPQTGEVKDFSTPCDVPEGWEKI